MIFHCALLSLLWFYVATAQSEVADNRITEIEVIGNLLYSQEEIRGSMYTRVGEPLDVKVLEQDIKFLWQNKRVRAEVYQQRVAGGIKLLVKVEEVPAIRDVLIRGNRELDREDILDAAKLTPGIPIDEIVAVRAKTDIIQYYRNEGFFFADVQLRYDLEASRAIFEIMEGPKVRISNIEFTGNEYIPSSYFLGLRRSLGSVMKLGGPFLFIRGDVFKENTLKEDLIQLRRLYRDEGFRDAIIEVKDLQFNEDRDRVAITMLVHEGPRYVVTSVDLAGNEAFSKEELFSLIKLKPGDYYSQILVERDEQALRKYYGEHGYPSHESLQDHWDFLQPQEQFSPGSKEVAVTYQIHEGQRVKIRDIKIKGNTITQDRVIRRELTFYPGEYVNTSNIQRSLSRLVSLDYFRDSSGTPSLSYAYEATEEKEQKDLAIEILEEGYTGNLNFGGGYSDSEGLFGRIFLRLINFDLLGLLDTLFTSPGEVFDPASFSGAGQQLEMDFTPGTQVSTFSIYFLEPDLFGDHIERTSLETRLFRRRRFYSTHTEDRRGGFLGLGKNWTEQFGTSLGWRQEQIRLSEIDANSPQLIFDQEGRNGLQSLQAFLRYAELDVPLSPTEGYILNLSGEYAGSVLGGDFDFYKTELSAKWYYPLYYDNRERAYIFSLRGRLGYANAYGDEPDVPYTERFFAGGQASIRGFSFRGVGPVQFDEPTGGEALSLAGAEFSFPIYSTAYAEGLREKDWIRGLFFVDGGSLGLDFHDDNFREFRLSTGIGLRFQLPVLPTAIALDFGFPVLYEDTDSRRIFSFSFERIF